MNWYVYLFLFVFCAPYAWGFFAAHQTYKKATAKKINAAFLDGYNSGKKDGYYEAYEKKITPNELREFLGLMPINEGRAEDDKQI